MATRRRTTPTPTSDPLVTSDLDSLITKLCNQEAVELPQTVQYNKYELTVATQNSVQFPVATRISLSTPREIMVRLLPAIVQVASGELQGIYLGDQFSMAVKETEVSRSA